MVELGTERVHDTVREIEAVTVVLNADGTERSRTTEKSKEHLRGRTTTNEKARVYWKARCNAKHGRRISRQWQRPQAAAR